MLFDGNNELIEEIYFGRQISSAGAISHSGGEKTADVLNFDLQKLQDTAQHIFICVNVYADGHKHAVPQLPVCTIFDASQAKLFELVGEVSTSAVFFPCLTPCRVASVTMQW